jgi:hypothetical protein
VTGGASGAVKFPSSGLRWGGLGGTRS